MQGKLRQLAPAYYTFTMLHGEGQIKTRIFLHWNDNFADEFRSNNSKGTFQIPCIYQVPGVNILH